VDAIYVAVLMVDAMVKIMLATTIHQNVPGTAFHLNLVLSDLTGNLLF
jgi:hypothetical protein